MSTPKNGLRIVIVYRSDDLCEKVFYAFDDKIILFGRYGYNGLILKMKDPSRCVMDSVYLVISVLCQG